MAEKKYCEETEKLARIAKATVSQHLKELKDAASRLGAALDFFVYDSIKIVLGLLFNGAL